MSNYKINGVNLDDIFEPRNGRTPAATNSGYKVGGTDLSDRYLNLNHSDSVELGFSLPFKVNNNSIEKIYSAKLDYYRRILTPIDEGATVFGRHYARATCISGDGTLIAIAYNHADNPRISFWSVNADTETLTKHSEIIFPVSGSVGGLRAKLTLSTDGTRVLFLTGDSNIVYVYRRSAGGTTWTLEFNENISFPYSVALSHDATRMCISNRVSGTGQVTIYSRSGTTWAIETTLYTEYGVNHTFGQSLSLNSSGTWLAIGVSSNSSSGGHYGRIVMYSRSGSSWVKGQTLAPNTTNPTNGAGSSVAISQDGTKLLAGCPAHISSFLTDRVVLYTLSANTWTLSADLPNSAGDSYNLGENVAIANTGRVLYTVHNVSSTSIDNNFINLKNNLGSNNINDKKLKPIEYVTGTDQPGRTGLGISNNGRVAIISNGSEGTNGTVHVYIFDNY